MNDTDKLLILTGKVHAAREMLDSAPQIFGIPEIARETADEIETTLESALDNLDKAERMLRRLTRSTLPIRRAS